MCLQMISHTYKHIFNCTKLCNRTVKLVAQTANILPIRYSSRIEKRLPILTLYTKDPCPLCDIAKDKIAVFKTRFELRTVDITEEGNERWWELYKYDIPVFHFEDCFLMKHRASLDLLKDALESYETDGQ